MEYLITSLYSIASLLIRENGAVLRQHHRHVS